VPAAGGRRLIAADSAELVQRKPRSHDSAVLAARRLDGRGAGRRPALVWPFDVRTNAGEPAAFALTLRAPEDDRNASRRLAGQLA
jgi:hypothetical protein